MSEDPEIIYANGIAGVQLPPGMTQEEADRLVAEGDEAERQRALAEQES